MGKGFTVLAIVLLIVIGVWYFGFRDVETGSIEESGEGLGTEVPALGEEGGDEMIVVDSDGGGVEEIDTSGENVVEMGDFGYNPKLLHINKWETVTWVNVGERANWPASDVHPSHTAYPGSSRTKCGTAEEEGMFDACKGLEKGESFSFTFDKEGEWEYHDHLRATVKGKVVVS
jgi:plastocyanin